jgi:hypothetical protein
MVGPEMLQEMENMVRKVQQNLKEAQDRQKSYADKKRRHLEFQTGDHVYLKVKAQKISLKLGNCAKLAPRRPLGSWKEICKSHPIPRKGTNTENLRGKG